MATLPLLKITFDAHIASWEIPIFKKALAAHLHWPAPTEKYRYPLWQCKTHFYRGQQQALLVSMGEHTLQAVSALSSMNGRLRLLADRTIPLSIASCRSHEFALRTDRRYHYQLFNYQAFNPEHYASYTHLKRLPEQQALLQQLLDRHTKIFAAGIHWAIDTDFDLRIEHIRRHKWVNTPAGRVLCFDLEFSARLFIPEFVGLGRGAGRGFGVVRRGGERAVKKGAEAMMGVGRR